MMLFTGVRPPDWLKWAEDNFLSPRSQPFSFSKLHEIILGLRYTSLEEEISECLRVDALDVQDAWGLTPLHWVSGFSRTVPEL